MKKQCCIGLIVLIIAGAIAAGVSDEEICPEKKIIMAGGTGMPSGKLPQIEYFSDEAVKEMENRAAFDGVAFRFTIFY